jgi:hypothetical protein
MHGARRRAAPHTSSGPRPRSRSYDHSLQYRSQCNRFRPRAERTQSHRYRLRRYAFSRRAAAVSSRDRNQFLVSRLTFGVHSTKSVKIKIQAIYNAKSAPNAMQGLARTREKPPAQEQWASMKEQWVSMEITMPRTMETVKNAGVTTSGCALEDGQWAGRAGRGRFAGFVCKDSWMSLGAIPTLYIHAIRTN